MDSDKSGAKVQHVSKKSSDELLRKFASDDGERAAKKASKRARKSRDCGDCESPLDNGQSSGGLAERRSLLPVPARKSALLRQLGIRGRAHHLKVREIRHRSLFGTIEKTWRRTIEGASKVFVEKHYNRHKRLINNDILY